MNSGSVARCQEFRDFFGLADVSPDEINMAQSEVGSEWVRVWAYIYAYRRYAGFGLELGPQEFVRFAMMVEALYQENWLLLGSISGTPARVCEWWELVGDAMSREQKVMAACYMLEQGLLSEQSRGLGKVAEAVELLRASQQAFRSKTVQRARELLEQVLGIRG